MKKHTFDQIKIKNFCSSKGRKLAENSTKYRVGQDIYHTHNQKGLTFTTYKYSLKSVRDNHIEKVGKRLELGLYQIKKKNMTNMQISSTLLLIREMKIITVLRHNQPSSRVAKMKQFDNTGCWQEHSAAEAPEACWWWWCIHFRK